MAIDESLLREDEEEEPVAVGDDEEGAITELSSTDVLEETDQKLKVFREREGGREGGNQDSWLTGNFIARLRFLNVCCGT